MKGIFVSILLFAFIFTETQANNTIKGKVLHEITKEALPFVFVQILNSKNKITYTDAEGNYEFRDLSPGKYTITYACIGFKIRTDTIQFNDGEQLSLIAYLQEDIMEIQEVPIAARKEFSQTAINFLDFKLRPHNTTQDLLRIVPGLFIAQHSGGGKAEQLFLRGFDVDHGTDVAISVDGMPVNMVSHAHGQGYADLHFVIPETIDRLSFSKGPYEAMTGDFNTAGAVRFQTKNCLPKNMVKYEVGKFGMQRGLVMVNILKNKDSVENKHNAFVASEYFYTRGFFISPQHFNRFNIFAKYHGRIRERTILSVSLSAFASKWNSSGQIPQRAVDNGFISWFGSIDPSEGGNTKRNNVIAELTSGVGNSGEIKNLIFLSNYNFNLFSNFTFFKEDSIHGDQIQQYENRNVFGYKGSYSQSRDLGGITIKTIAGIGFRADRIHNIGLAHTVKRQFINDIKKGDIAENNVNGFLDFSFLLSEKFTVNVGVRYDYFTFRYTSRLGDTSYTNMNKGLASPKLNLYYKIGQHIQLYTSGGVGFHSNDARVAVQAGGNSLPKALGFDLGSNIKLGKKIFINLALWYMRLQTEFVYGGDDGLIGPSGRTRRTGIDLTARYQLLPWLFMDADLNLARPRFIDLPSGMNYVTLAPSITGIGGLGVNNLKGFSGSLRYRYLGRRPAMEDNSVIASSYFIMDAVLNYQFKVFALNLSAENILNRTWREAQFGTESRLKGEPEPRTEIHFTPGTPFSIKIGLSFLF